MTQNDKGPTFELSDIRAALGLLTRLPVRVDFKRAQSRAQLSVWAYPLVGVVVGVLAGLVGSMSLLLDLPNFTTATLMVATAIILTGALHEDGLADSADGLWGGWDKDHRLKIMKDSHIGVYGVVAVGLSLMLRISLLAALVGQTNLIIAAIAISALSRAPMVALMHLLPNARDEGLSASVGHAPKLQTSIALGIAVGIALITLLGASVLTLVLVGGTATIWALIAKSKIGGQTGDILGATQQLSEIAILIGLCIWL